MKPDARQIARHEFKATDSVLLDTNVWLFIHGPQGDPSDSRPRIYSRELKRILEAKSTICMDVLIMSEFINRYARLEYNLVSYALLHENFKEFRDSDLFKPVAKRIADAARRVLAHCKCVESGFPGVDIAEILSDYECGACDFNDKVIGELCRGNGWALVTHDRDFGGGDFLLLTANKRLLKQT